MPTDDLKAKARKAARSAVYYVEYEGWYPHNSEVDVPDACADAVVEALRPPGDPSLRDAIINAISPHAAACQDNPCGWCDTDHARADAVLALVAEYQGQPATEPAEPDPFDHVLEVRGGGRWAIDHPDSCSDPATCLVAKTAYAPAFSARGVPDGLYQAGVNDLGDRLLIGDRIGG